MNVPKPETSVGATTGSKRGRRQSTADTPPTPPMLVFIAKLWKERNVPLEWENPLGDDGLPKDKTFTKTVAGKLINDLMQLESRKRAQLRQAKQQEKESQAKACTMCGKSMRIETGNLFLSLIPRHTYIHDDACREMGFCVCGFCDFTLQSVAQCLSCRRTVFAAQNQEDHVVNRASMHPVFGRLYAETLVVV